MASMRTTQLNKENAENVLGNALGGKSRLLGGADGGAGAVGMKTRGATLRARAPLGNVANKNIQQQQQQLPAAKKLGQQQAFKPAKPVRQLNARDANSQQPGLTRQKASANLVLANNDTANNRRLLPGRKAAEEAKEKTRQQSLGSGRRSSQDDDDAMDVLGAASPPVPIEVVEQDEVEAVEVEVESAYSTAKNDLALRGVEDIDREDKDNPQLACEYVNEIYEYLRQMERAQAVNENYLEAVPGATIRPKMRNMLVDWLVEVHQQFNLLQETLYLTVATIDRYLQVKASIVTTKQLQLVGVTAMFIACKYEEMYPPEIGDFVYITDHAYSGGQIRKMEMAMIAALNFDLGRPLPLHFLRRDSKAAQVDAHTHSLAKYLMELTLTDYKMAHLAPSIVAASALALSMRLLHPSRASLRQLWTPTMAHYSAYSLEEIAPVVAQVADVVRRSSAAVDAAATKAEGEKDKAAIKGKKPWKQLESVGLKYTNKKFMKISLLPELRSELIDKLASGEIL